MTLETLHEMGLVTDYTEIHVHRRDGSQITRGKWFEGRILDHMQDELNLFSWGEGNRIQAYLK